MKEETIIRCYEKAIEEDVNYIGFLKLVPNFEQPVIVIVSRVNMEKELDILKNFGVDNDIIAITRGQTFSDIENDLVLNRVW